MSATYKLRNRELIRQSSGVAQPGSEAVYQQRIDQLKLQLVPLEEKLTDALSVGSNSPAQIGTVVDGLDQQLRMEVDRTVRDFRATGTFRKPLSGVLKSKGDLLAFGLFIIQGQKFIDAVSNLLKKDKGSLSTNDVLAFTEAVVGLAGAGFATAQGLSVTILQADIEEMASTAGKLNTMTRLGRWTGIAGIGAFGFSVLSASLDLRKHSLQWTKAFAEGDSKDLGASTIQISGDAILIGSSTWGAKHTGSIIKTVMTTSTEMRAFAWAQASPKLVSFGARANLIGLIGTALQLLGEGLYNYLNLDELQKWMQSSAWGHQTKQRSVQDEWNELAKVVQKPTCELVHDTKQTYLILTLPGLSTQEIDERKLQLLAYQQQRDAPMQGEYNPNLPPLRWRESTSIWATRFIIVSKDQQALTLKLPISDSLQTSDFALVFDIGYQLEAERDLIHRTIFILKDLQIITNHGARIPTKGNFKLTAVETMPFGTGKGSFKIIKKEELAVIDV